MMCEGKERPEILRLDDVSRWAGARLKRTIRTGNTGRAARAARLVEAAESTANSIVMASVAPYNEAA